MKVFKVNCSALEIDRIVNWRADVLINVGIYDTRSNHCYKKNRVNQVLKVHKMLPQGNINSTR